MARAFSEDSRVKIPALLHFTRLGYQYRRLKDIRAQLDFETNIDRKVLRDSLNKLNRSSDSSSLMPMAAPTKPAVEKWNGMKPYPEKSRQGQWYILLEHLLDMLQSLEMMYARIKASKRLYRKKILVRNLFITH